MSTLRLRLLLVLAIITGCGGSSAPVRPSVPEAPRVLVNTDAEGVALSGHDPVAYVTDGAPVLGSTEHSSRHDGAVYRFASAEHATTFASARERHAPRYGGYCAFAASQNRLSPSDPQVFLVHDGKLLMFTNRDFLDQFQKDPAGNLRKADEHWPGLVAQHGKSLADEVTR
jgi:YHS domain-containing protein